MPKEYKYKQNIVADKVYDILQKHKYVTDYQVSNYRNKIIGFIVRISDVNTNSVFIPCLPSSVLSDIPIQYMDNIQWTDYVTTRDLLFQIQENTKNELLCKPLLKVVEDGLIVGILTETNQVLQINPPINNDVDDGIDIIKVKGYADNGYSDADKTVQTTSSEDSQRKEVVRNIRLETQFYSSFKTTIRILLNDPLYSTLKEKLIIILNDNRYLYRIKLQKLEILIKHLLRNTVSFHDIEEDVSNKMLELWKHAQECVSKKLLSIINIDDSAQQWEVLAIDLYRWAMISRITVPTEFSALIAFVIQTVKPEQNEPILAIAEFDSLLQKHKEIVLGAATSLLVNAPEKINTGKVKHIAMNISRLIVENKQQWFGENEPSLNESAMIDLINDYIELIEPIN